MVRSDRLELNAPAVVLLAQSCELLKNAVGVIVACGYGFQPDRGWGLNGNGKSWVILRLHPAQVRVEGILLVANCLFRASNR